MSAQQVVQHLPSARRVGGNQYATIELREKAIQGGEGAFRSRVDPQIVWRDSGEVTYLRSHRAERGIGLERLEGYGGEGIELCFELVRLHEKLRWGQHRALDVMPAVLIARRDAAPGLPQRGWQCGVVHDDRVGRKVVEQCRGLLEEQRQVEFD